VNDLDPVEVGRDGFEFLDLPFQRIPTADQQQPKAALPRGQERPLDHRPRSVIAVGSGAGDRFVIGTAAPPASAC